MTTDTAEVMELDGREVHRGDPVVIDGKRGRFFFRAHVKTPTDEWVDVYGGTSGRERSRSFHVERVHPRIKGRRR